MNPLLDGEPEDYDPLAGAEAPSGDSAPAAKMNPLLDEVSKPGVPQKPDIEVRRPDASNAAATLATELTQPGTRTSPAEAAMRPRSEPEAVKPAPPQEAKPDPRIDALMREQVGLNFKPLITRRGSLREGPGVG